jgi:hypothetical protein
MICTIRGPPIENVQLELHLHHCSMYGYMERTILVQTRIMIKTSVQ